MTRTFLLLAAVSSSAVLAAEASPPALRVIPGYTDRFVVPSGPVPTGYRLVKEPRWGVVAAGSMLFGVSTVSMVVAAFATDNPLVAVPVVGHFEAVTEARRNFEGNGLMFSLLALGSLIDLVAQQVGLALVIIGLTSPARWLEADVTAPAVTLVPAAAGAPLGASLLGHF